MRYHAHLTLNKISNIPKGRKQTDILLLDKNKQQLDIMLTKHYKIGCKNINSFDDIKNDIHNLRLENIIRIKIEQDDEFYLPITDKNYIEVHMLCKENSYIDSSWVLSKNPKRQIEGKNFYFLNKRIYEGKDVKSIKENLDIILRDVDYIELKIEQVVYDSNYNRDKWWGE